MIPGASGLRLRVIWLRNESATWSIEMASELIAGLGIFKTLFDMTKGLKDMNDAAIRSATAVELLEKILTAREQQAALLERVGELEKEVAGFET